jgi:hypothetical protein
MHGTEHRVSERRALRLLAPRKPFYPASASTLPDAPQPFLFSKTGPFARNGLSLTRMTSACAGPIPGSKVLACYFAHSLAGLPARSAFCLSNSKVVSPITKRGCIKPKSNRIKSNETKRTQTEQKSIQWMTIYKSV